MPGATNGVVDHEALGERAMIVAAEGIDRENFRANLSEQNLRVADMAEQLAI
jgi:hypothetical protein